MSIKLLALFVICLALSACQAPGPQSNNSAGANSATTTNTAKPDSAKTAPTDMKALASKIVNQSAADQPGRFPIYCNLTQDERCKEMVGELVVNGR
jgi:hypothetical protein